MKKIILGLSIMSSVLLRAQIEDTIVQTSQEFSYELSDPYPAIEARGKLYFEYGGGITAVKINKAGLHVQYFTGEKLNLDHTSVTPVAKNAIIQGSIQQNDMAYILYSVWDKPKSEEKLYVLPVDLQYGGVKGQPAILITVKGKVAGVNGKVFSIEESFDQSTYLIRYRKRPEVRNDKKSFDVIGMSVFNKSLEPVWSSDQTMPYTEARMNNLDFAVDSKGNAYMLTEVMKEGEKRRYSKEGKANYTVELIAITNAGLKNQNLPLSLEGKYISDVGFFEGPNESLLLAGFYASTDEESVVDGAFLTRFTDAGGQELFNTYEIPVEVLKLYESERTQRKIDKQQEKDAESLGLVDLKLSDVVYEPDGSIFLIGEQFITTIIHSRDAGGHTVTDTSYYFRDILLLKISDNGTLDYMKRLPKNQGSGQKSDTYDRLFGYNPLEVGYKFISTEENLYLVYVDNLRNLNIDPNTFPKRHESGFGGYLTAYQVDKLSGEVNKLSILNLRNAKGIPLFKFSPKAVVHVENNVFGVECYKKNKEDVMVRIQIND